MKSITLMVFTFLSVPALAQNHRYDSSSIALANRIVYCANELTELSKQGFEIFSADVAKTILLDQYPVLESGISTTLLLRKDFQPMQGYTQITTVLIESNEKCFGIPEVDGECSEIISICKVTDTLLGLSESKFE